MFTTGMIIIIIICGTRAEVTVTANDNVIPTTILL